MSSDVFLTRKGYEELLEKLEAFKQKRKKISKAVQEAREHGDISENAEYSAAKEALAFNEKAIAELEEKLSRARILDNEDIDKDKAYLGATVKLKDLDSGEELEYILVSALEADLAQGKISVDSPVGKSLLGRKKNEKVEIQIPAGVLKYQILEIRR